MTFKELSKERSRKKRFVFRIDVRFINEHALVGCRGIHRWTPSGMQSLPFQGTTTGMCLISTAIRDEFGDHIFKFIHTKLAEAPLLQDGDLLVTRELELGSTKNLHHKSVLCSLMKMDLMTSWPHQGFQGALEQPVEATGYIHYQQDCC